MERKFSEFSKFRESDKSLNHIHVLRSMPCWLYGNILVIYTRGCFVRHLEETQLLYLIYLDLEKDHDSNN